MNEQTLPPTSQSVVVSLSPAQPCFTCKRLAHYAHIDIGVYNNGRETHLDILCPLHGYYTSDAYDSHKEQDALDSVARFVVWLHGDRGRCFLVAPLDDASTIPEHDQPGELTWDLLLWYARYESIDG